MSERVVITGLGLVSPLGNEVELFWDGLLYRDSVPTNYPYRNSAYMSNRLAYLVQERESIASMFNEDQVGKATAYALHATKQALRDARITGVTGEAIGVYLGTGTGDSDVLEAKSETSSPISPLLTFAFGPAAAVANHFDFNGPNVTVSTACSAGCYSLSLARDAILNGWADVVIAGGTETVSRVGQGCFNRIDGLDPKHCRPFDMDRAGTVYGEGAAVLVLESEHHARQRGIEHWYAEIKGIGWSCDGYHPTAPDPVARQSELAIQRALQDANLTTLDIDGVMCHGTGTELNDLVESKCLHALFGHKLEQLFICAIKSKLGHSGGASGAFSCLTGSLILKHHIVPPLANIETIDPRCELNLPMKEPIQRTAQNVLVNAYAFGGNNISIILGA